MFTYWDTLIRAYPPQCWAAVHGLAEKHEKIDGLRRLSLKNFIGAFLVLLTGMVISFLVFIGEVFLSFTKKKIHDVKQMKNIPAKKDEIAGVVDN